MQLPTSLLAFVTVLAGWSPARETADGSIDLAARQRSIPILEEHISEREERLGEIAADIMRLDKRVEAKVDKIVRKLAGIKDSQKSGYRVSQVKQQAMQGLERSIQTYQSKRASLIEDAKEGRTAIPAEVLEGDAKVFDERIEQRVAQILEISKSFTQNADVAKYQKVAGGGYSWGGWYEDLEEISPAYRQNRRDRTMDKKQRDEVMKALANSIARHEARVSDMNLALKRNLSPTERSLIGAELKRNEDILAARKEQYREMSEVGQPNTASVDRNEAQDLQRALGDAVADLRQDMQTIFRKYAELNRERDTLFRAKANLEARKKWISDHVRDDGGEAPRP